MRHIRILVADDHRLMREAVGLALGREPDLEIVGEAADGGEVLAHVAREQPDVVLLDIRMPGIDGLQVLDRLHDEYPDVKVVMLSAIDEPQVAQDALRRGAAAYLEKHVEPAGLASSLRQAMAGAISIPRSSRPRDSAEDADTQLGLSSREREILALVATGSSNSEIAAALWVSEQTVKYHLTHVYRKLGVRGRTEAVRYAYEHGLAGTVAELPSGSAHPFGPPAAS